MGYGFNVENPFPYDDYSLTSTYTLIYLYNFTKSFFT